MRFRPCIDILNGKVVQIVGSTLNTEDKSVITNYVSERTALWYAELYKKDELSGGHIISLGEGNVDVVKECLAFWTGGFQYGGGVTSENAKKYLDMGASHVIITSFVFPNSKFSYERIKELIKIVGKKRLVLDLSCRKKGDTYFVVMNKWQSFTNVEVTSETLKQLSAFCDEFLVHAADVEGKKGGMDVELLKILSEAAVIPITYAGGISSINELAIIREVGKGMIDFTIGSALDIFGGKIEYAKVLEWTKQNQ